MKILKDFIEKPVITIVLSVSIVLIGVYGLLQLSWRDLPENKKSSFMIFTNMKNPSTCEIVNEVVTKKIENQIKKMNGVDYFISTSNSNSSKIQVSFTSINKDPLNDLRDAVAKAEISSEAKHPIIYAEDYSGEVATINFYSHNISNNELSDYLQDILMPQLKKIDGVGNIEIYGFMKPYFAIQFDLYKLSRLSEFGLRISDLSRCIDAATNSYSLGNVNTHIKTYQFSRTSDVKDLSELKNIYINADRKIKLSDVATLTIKNSQKNKKFLFNGITETINMEVFKTNQGNPIGIMDEIKKILKDLPPHVKYNIKNNYEEPEIVLQKTKKTFWEACILIIFILIIFLGAIKITILPVIVIPMSIIGTFIFMHLLHFSLNQITLMAFLMAIGLLVDDAILVIEKIESDKGRKSIFASMQEIALPIIIMTATLFFVFLPVIFIKGEIGSLLKEFSATISVSVGISGLLSLTLTPMACRYFMKDYHPFVWTENFLNFLTSIYILILRNLIKYRTKIIALVFFLNMSGLSLLFFLKMEYLPQVEKDYFGIFTQGLNNIKLEYLEKSVPIINQIMEKYKDHLQYYEIHLENNKMIVRGRVKKNRNIIENNILQDLQKILPEYKFIVAGESSNNVCFDVYFYSHRSIEDVKNIAYSFVDDLEATHLLQQYIFIKKKTFGLNVDILKDKCAYYNIDVYELQELLEFLMQDIRLKGKISIGNRRYKIIFKKNKEIANNFQKLSQYVWHFKNRKMLLNEIIRQVPKEDYINIENYNGLNCYKAELLFKSNITMGEAVGKIENIAKKLPKDFHIAFGGSAKIFKDNSQNLFLIFGSCLLSIFLILSLQFNSFYKSLLVMLTVPIALTGALFVLYFSGTINIFSIIGALTLVALITKHGILFMSAISESKDEDILEISKKRFRPVLMTTIAMILGNIPLLFETTNAMAPIKQMALVIVPGLTYGTIVILFVFPMIIMNVNKIN